MGKAIQTRNHLKRRVGFIRANPFSENKLAISCNPAHMQLLTLSPSPFLIGQPCAYARSCGLPTFLHNEKALPSRETQQLVSLTVDRSFDLGEQIDNEAVKLEPKVLHQDGE